MEDMELLCLLQQPGHENSLLEVSIVNDIDDYSENIGQYMSFRRKLFTEIMRLH